MNTAVMNMNVKASLKVTTTFQKLYLWSILEFLEISSYSESSHLRKNRSERTWDLKIELGAVQRKKMVENVKTSDT